MERESSPAPPSSDSSSTTSMWWDLTLQAIIILSSIISYLWVHDIPKKLLNKYKSHRNKPKHLARSHFLKAAALLSRSSLTQSLSEITLAISLDPTDAAFHVIKSVILEKQGYKPAAVEALDVALSPLAVGSLTKEERADAVARRAELKMEVGKDGWEVVERELREVVEVRRESGKIWWLLGKCCEGLGKKEEAIEAFENSVRVDPEGVKAKEALARLKGNDESS